MINLPDVAELVPHQAPMILIDKLLAVDESTVHCQVFITTDSQFFEQKSNSVGAWVGIEYMAQTVSAWSGYQSFLNNEVPPIGFLLGCRRYQTESDCFHDGDVLDVYAEQLMESDGMSAFSCLIKCNGIVLASAQLNAFVPNELQLEDMLKGNGND
jgi:predicted hotdog family 3-hydroxylacyl-ACP dehydratase